MATRSSLPNVTPGQLVPWILLGAGVALAYKWTKGWWAPGAGDHVPMPPGQQPTLSASHLNILAERVYAAAWEGWVFWEDEQAMIQALWDLGNDADVAALFNVYGIRTGPMPLDRASNLVQTVHECLDEEEVEALNVGLAAKGITYLF